MDGEIVFFDFETGGITDDKPEIQLAAIAVDREFKEVDSFSMLIQFDEAAADAEALAMNHYDRARWAVEALPRGKVTSEFDAFLQRHKSVEMVSKRTGRPYQVARLAGHNVVTFDMPRLRRLYGDRFLPAHPLALDTLQLALWRFEGAETRPADAKLPMLAAFLGVEVDGKGHEALADVRTSAAIARVLTRGRWSGHAP